MLTLDMIYHASFVLKDVIRKTDLIRAPKINPECELYLKPENLQFTGSFKIRGAGYMISQLTAEEKARGVIACSAGNHAQGVALAASTMGIQATIVMPLVTPLIKVDSTKSYGADVVLHGNIYDEAYIYKAIKILYRCANRDVTPQFYNKKAGEEEQAAERQPATE